jgi:hypothetical protein
MVTKRSHRRVLRASGAFGAAILLFSPMAEAQVSGAVCNTPESASVFVTTAIVWADGVRTEVKVGERGLTANIAYSEQALIDWMRREFAGDSPDVNVGFNDCGGSQLQPQRSPVSMESGSDQTPSDFAPAPPAPPPVIDEPTGNDSAVGGIDDSLIVGDGTDVLFG